jgi:RNase P/RNase MRP subunit p30
VVGENVRVSLPGAKGIEGSICVGPAGEPLNAAAKQSPRAVIVSDARIDRKLLDTVKSKSVILCVPFDKILGSVGLRRSSTIYLTSRLAQYAIKRGIRVSFISMAGSEEMLCSPVQLIELAKLLGVKEDYAREAVTVTNAELIS